MSEAPSELSRWRGACCLRFRASTLIAQRTGAVRLAGDVTVMAEAEFHSAPPCDVFIVCGGPGWREQVRNPAMLEFLRSRRREETASACTGSSTSRGRRDPRRAAGHDPAQRGGGGNRLAAVADPDLRQGRDAAGEPCGGGSGRGDQRRRVACDRRHALPHRPDLVRTHATTSPRSSSTTAPSRPIAARSAFWCPQGSPRITLPGHIRNRLAGAPASAGMRLSANRNAATIA